MSFLDEPWFLKAMEAHDAGIDHVYLYEIHSLKEHYGWFTSNKKHMAVPYTKEYTPNPFRHQYDLTMFCWVNFYSLIAKETIYYRALHEKNNKAGYDKMADIISLTKTINGITREDFLFAAGQMRWPTTVMPDGAHQGLFIRDPWSDKRIKSISNKDIKNVISFGGGGQGKTLVSLAFSLMIFDYFIFTQKGARCMLSTVNKDKLNSVGWSYLCNLNSSTNEGISLYAGRAKISGDHTLSRPNNKDKGGVFKGILIGNQMNNQTIVDKLTGSHGHPFIVYVLDELQSTPDPPIIAAPNYTMHAGDWRILGSGNFGDNSDTLAVNVKPDTGWDSVNEHTGSWISTMKNSFKAICLHFNNEDSPGMIDEMHRKFPHMPSRKNLDNLYPDKSKRNMHNDSYRRFWVGYRLEKDDETTVISEKIVKENFADSPLDLKSVMHSFFSFDSAPAEIDRNILICFREGVCNVTNQRVFGPSNIYELKKATESSKYYRESSNEILEISKKNNITSGGGVVDWTGRPAQSEMLAEKNFMVHRLIYNKGTPDGIRKDKHTGRTEREIRLNVSLDFNNSVPPDRVCAHHVAENMISLGAWALREYIKAGRFRGITPDLFKFLSSKREISDELYNRSFRLKTSLLYGDRFHLESKVDFKTRYGFSPDVLDCFFEAAWYMLVIRRLPLTPVADDDIVTRSEDKEYTSEEDDHLDLWNMDGLSKL